MRLEKSEKERQEEKVFEAERVVHTEKDLGLVPLRNRVVTGV